MLKILIIKIVFLITIMFATSCSYLAPQSANEYTVTKKSPLVIPPDMNMTPPSKKEKEIGFKNNSSTKGKDDFSLEGILTGDVKPDKKIVSKKKQRISDRLKIVKSLLKMKDSAILK